MKTSRNPEDRLVDAMLRDMAYVFRLARRMSGEIRSERRYQAEPKTVRLTDTTSTVTLGA